MTKTNPHNGKHILAEFWQCQCAPSLLCETTKLISHLVDAVTQTGLTLVGQTAHTFSGMQGNSSQSSGVTVSLLLAESHLCLHTWGELNAVTLDIYVCNFLQDNSDKADALLTRCQTLLMPKTVNVQCIHRQHAPPHAHYQTEK